MDSGFVPNPYTPIPSPFSDIGLSHFPFPKVYTKETVNEAAYFFDPFFVFSSMDQTPIFNLISAGREASIIILGMTNNNICELGYNIATAVMHQAYELDRETLKAGLTVYQEGMQQSWIKTYTHRVQMTRTLFTLPFQFISDCKVRGIDEYRGYFHKINRRDIDEVYTMGVNAMAPRFMAVVEWAQNVNLHWAVVDFVDNYMPSDEYVLDAINFVVFFGLMVVDMANDEFVDLLIDYADRLWEDVIPGKSRQDLIESGLTSMHKLSFQELIGYMFLYP